MKLLYLAFNGKGFGETALGLQLAQELRRAGCQARFLVPRQRRTLVRDSGFEFCEFPLPSSADSVRRLVRLTDDNVRAYRPDAIVMSDYMVTTTFLASVGAKSQLQKYDLPIVAIDTWDTDRTGFELDVIGRENRRIPDWRDAVDLRLIPVPVAAPRPGDGYYSCLPQGVRQGSRTRRHIRRALGLSDNARIVLHCSAPWQYAYPKDNDARRQAVHFPKLLTHYIGRMGKNVHIVHVGPRAYDMQSYQYHWLPTLTPTSFGRLLGSADSLVVFNASSTVVGKAIASDVPAVVLTNSYSISSAGDTERLGNPVSAALAQLLETMTPLQPFYLWPMGLHSFLAPLFRNNPFCRAVTWLEALDEEAVGQALERAVFDSSERQALIERQRDYADSVRALPSPAVPLGQVMSGRR